MSKTISSGRLNPGATYLVRGNVGYSHISRHTTDVEREEANKRRAHPIAKNYTTITIYNAQVLCKDPTNPTIEEQYALESLYNSSSPKYPGKNFSAMNKSRNLPQVGVLEANADKQNYYVETKLENELAAGLDVILVMRVYKGQGTNNGVSLDRVLVNEPIKYFGGNSEVDKKLAEFGITFKAMPPSEKVATEESVQNATVEVSQPVVATQPVAQFQQEAPVVAPAPNPEPIATETPFSSYGTIPNDITFGPGNRKY